MIEISLADSTLLTFLAESAVSSHRSAEPYKKLLKRLESPHARNMGRLLLGLPLKTAPSPEILQAVEAMKHGVMSSYKHGRTRPPTG